MNSHQVKAAFEAVGLPVFVADQGVKFRICRRVGSKSIDLTSDDRVTMSAVAIALGLTDTRARVGGMFNGNNEMFAYKPGAVRAI